MDCCVSNYRRRRGGGASEELFHDILRFIEGFFFFHRSRVIVFPALNLNYIIFSFSFFFVAAAAGGLPFANKIAASLQVFNYAGRLKKFILEIL